MRNPVTIPAGESINYTFTVLANSGGTFLGQITFQEVIGNQQLSEQQKRY